MITNVATTQATVHESQRTEAIHQALADKALPPEQHLVDSAYVDAEVLTAAGSSSVLAWSVRVGWTTAGRPGRRGPTIATASPSIGSKSTCAVAKGINLKSGRRARTGMARASWSPSTLMTAGPARPASYVPGARTNRGGCESNLAPSMRPCRLHANY